MPERNLTRVNGADLSRLRSTESSQILVNHLAGSLASNRLGNALMLICERGGQMGRYDFCSEELGRGAVAAQAHMRLLVDLGLVQEIFVPESSDQPPHTIKEYLITSLGRAVAEVISTAGKELSS